SGTSAICTQLISRPTPACPATSSRASSSSSRRSATVSVGMGYLAILRHFAQDSSPDCVLASVVCSDAGRDTPDVTAEALVAAHRWLDSCFRATDAGLAAGLPPTLVSPPKQTMAPS